MTRSTWIPWREHFERNRARPMPLLSRPAGLTAAAAAALASSLARFQAGETGEARVVNEIARSRLSGVDGDYRRALALFIAEEGRHARILAAATRALGGRLIATDWTKRAFVIARRLLGVRFKLLVLHAAEVIGIGFYQALADRLPAGALRAALEQIAGDERAHLLFHRAFFRTQAARGWRRGLFRLAWTALGTTAALVVLLDHRRTLRALGAPVGALAGRLMALVRLGGDLDQPGAPALDSPAAEAAS